MSGDEQDEGDGDVGSPRARLTAALGAAFLLAAVVGAVLATGGSEEASAPTGACFVAWNEDVLAPRQDGIHAYTEHGYRQTLVARVDRQGKIVEDPDDELPPDDPDARCAVIFASPQVDEEPEFGVRVFERKVRGEESGWTGLSLADGTKLQDIADLQAEAVAISNAALGANGTLSEE